MSHWETFNPYLKRKRLQQELEIAAKELEKVKTTSADTETQISCLEQHNLTRNILLDAPTEIILAIMKYITDERDIMALYDVLPRMKAIFQQNNLVKFFFKRDYPNLDVINDMNGFIYSGKTHESVEKAILPAGKYVLGDHEWLLSNDIVENLLCKKRSFRYREQEGVYLVRNYNRRSGKFVVYKVEHSENINDSEGFRYVSKLRSSIDYFACVPISLAAKVSIRNKHLRRKIIDSISPIKCTFTKNGSSFTWIHYEGTLEWHDRVHGFKTLKWKSKSVN